MYGRNAPDGNDVPLCGSELLGAEPEGAAGVSESLRASQSPSSGTDRRFAGKAEAEEMAVSMQEAPDAEPEMPELLPDETPAIEPTPEPLIIPMDPDIEPDIRMPEEMKTAA